MTKSQFNQQAQNMIERGKEAAEQGKQRHLVLRKQDGTQIVETNLTVAVAVGFVLVISGFLTWPIMLITAIAAYATKVKLELGQDNQISAEQ